MLKMFGGLFQFYNFASTINLNYKTMETLIAVPTIIILMIIYIIQQDQITDK